jgi:hypothetical protein
MAKHAFWIQGVSPKLVQLLEERKALLGPTLTSSILVSISEGMVVVVVVEEDGTAAATAADVVPFSSSSNGRGRFFFLLFVVEEVAEEANKDTMIFLRET